MKMGRISYQSYIRNHWPLPFVEPWLYGPTRLAKRPLQYGFILCTRLGKRSGWHYHAKDLIALGHAIDQYLSVPKHLAAFTAEAEKVRKENYKFSRIIEGLEVEKFNRDELAELWRRWYFTHSRFCAAFMPIDATDETLESDIQQALAKAKRKLSPQEISYLLTPNAASYTQREHREFCRLLRQHAARLGSPLARRAYQRHAERWWWSPMGWGQPKPLTARDVAREIVRTKNPAAVLLWNRQAEQRRTKALEQKRKLLKQLPPKIIHLLNAFAVLAKMHDVRKEMQMRMMRAGISITEAILRKSAVPSHFRDFLSAGEYLRLTKGEKLSRKILRSRKQAFWCQATSGGHLLLLSGRMAVEKLQRSRMYERVQQGQRFIRGLPVSPGHAQGRVRMGFDPKILRRMFRTGEILVTGQTTPDFIMVMRKAAAIVTDEGGITSHAAIVSRELNIPCVVGTKIATQVLKDGDRVEVDANSGVVRKLKPTK